MLIEDRSTPGLFGLIGISRPDHEQIRNSPQGGQMFHWLVGWAVFAQADAIVGHDPDRVQMRKRAYTNRSAHVVGKYQEGCSKRNVAFVISQAIHNGTHAVLAHPKMQVAANGVLGLIGRG